MKNFVVNNIKEKYNMPGVYEGTVSVYSDTQEDILFDEDEVVILPVKNALSSIYDFTYDKNKDAFDISDYGEIRDQFVKAEQTAIYDTIRSAAEAKEKEKIFVSPEIHMTTYKEVQDLANKVVEDLRDSIRDSMELNFGRLQNARETSEKISFIVLDEIEKNLDVIKNVMMKDYDLNDPEDLEYFKSDLNDLITELTEKITNALTYALSRNEHIRFETEALGVVDMFASENKTMLVSDNVTREWDDNDIQKHSKDFIRKELYNDIVTNDKAIMLFEFKKGLTGSIDERPLILIEDDWTKVNAIINEDKSYTIANIEEISLDDFMDKFFDTYYDMNYRNADTQFQHIGASNLDLRNELYYVVAEGNSQYLKDNHDLTTEKGLRDAIEAGFELSDVKKNMNRFEQYQAREIIEDLYAEFQADLDKVNEERENAYSPVEASDEDRFVTEAEYAAEMYEEFEEPDDIDLEDDNR